MRKSILAVAALFVLVMLSACGGGGGGAASSSAPPTTPTNPPPTNPPPTVPTNPWVPTTPTTPATTTVVTVPGVTTVGSIATGNTGNGFTVIGLDATGNIVVTMLDPAGLPVWSVTIPTPVGFTSLPIQVVVDATHVVAHYARVNSQTGLQSVWYLAFDSAGNIVTDETNVGDGSNAGDLILDPDGDTIYVSRKTRSGSATPARIFRASLTSGHAPISIDPPTNPMDIILQGGGLYVVGDNNFGQYTSDFSGTLWKFMAGNASPYIFGGVYANSRLYIASIARQSDLNLAFWVHDQFGTLLSLLESTVPALTDFAYIKADVNGDIYFTIRGKLGKVDKLTGAVLTTSPPTVPVGDWTIIGTKGYFSLGATIQVYDLTTL